MFNISNTKPAQTFVFVAQISTNIAQTNGIVLVIISFYGVPTSRRFSHSIASETLFRTRSKHSEENVFSDFVTW